MCVKMEDKVGYEFKCTVSNVSCWLNCRKMNEIVCS